MDIIHLEKKDKVAVIHLNNGKNTQNLYFAQTLNNLLEEVHRDISIQALVISSTDQKNWSQGLDLDWISQEKQAGNEEDIVALFVQLDQVYHHLMLLPVPVIAAINGHAFGAGAFLATACDYRFMNAQKGFFCFPEIDLKMDFLPGVFHMMVHKLPDFKLPDLVYTGRRTTALELEKCFIVDKACQGVADTNQLALEFARTFDKDRTLIAAYKRKLHGRVADELVKLNLEHLKAQPQT